MDNFNGIVNTYAKQVYNHTLRILGNKEDAEEATQDVFLKIYKGLERFRGDSQLSTWIWRITTNVCYSRISKKRLATNFLDDVHNQIADAETYTDTIVDEETKEIIAKHLSDLSPHQANALLLFYFEELNYKEIADVLEMPEGTIATLLHRGRANLKKKLEVLHKEDVL